MDYEEIETPFFEYYKYLIKKAEINGDKTHLPFTFTNEGLPFNDYVDIFELAEILIVGLNLPKNDWKFIPKLIKMCVNGENLPESIGQKFHDAVKNYACEKGIHLIREYDWMPDNINTFLKGRDYYLQTVEFCKKMGVPSDRLATDIAWSKFNTPISIKEILFLAEERKPEIWDWINAILKAWKDTDLQIYPISKSGNIWRCNGSGLIISMLDLSKFVFVVTDSKKETKYKWSLFRPVYGGTSLADIFCKVFPGITTVDTENMIGIEFQNPFKLFRNKQITKDVFMADSLSFIVSNIYDFKKRCIVKIDKNKIPNNLDNAKVPQPPPQKKCEFCTTVFYSKTKSQRFCGPKCRDSSRSKRYRLKKQ